MDAVRTDRPPSALAQSVREIVREADPWDPLAWIVSTLTLLAVALLASWIPARRALHVDPVTALRGDS